MSRPDMLHDSWPLLITGWPCREPSKPMDGVWTLQIQAGHDAWQPGPIDDGRALQGPTNYSRKNPFYVGLQVPAVHP